MTFIIHIYLFRLIIFIILFTYNHPIIQHLPMIVEENKDEKPKFTPTDLIIRRNHFHNQLIEIVKSHHKVLNFFLPL